MDAFCVNRAILAGNVTHAPQPSHTNHGIQYLTFPLEVQRLSGTPDTLNVVASEALLAGCPILPGQTVRVTGEVRSFNNRSGIGSRLVITFFAKTLSPFDGPHENRLTLAGVLCKSPTLRRTPLGREICDVLLAVNRPYGRSDYLPCIIWGTLARTCAQLDTGDPLRLTGRLQSRKYRKLLAQGEEERTAYEISVLTVEEPQKGDAVL